MNAKFKKAQVQITSDDRNLRKEAVEILGEINNKQSIELLISALKDKNWSVRGSVAEALGKTGNHQAVEPLISLINDKNIYVRWKAVKALGKIKDSRALDPLIKLLDNNGLRLKKEAITALGEIGDKNAAGPIISALKDKKKEIVKEACESLDKLNVIPSDNNDKAIYYITKRDWDECVNIGKPAVELLIPMLENEDDEVKIKALESLGKIGENRAIDSLIKTLKDSSSQIRGKSAEALGLIGNHRAVTPLIAALSDSDSYVRAEASGALGNIKDNMAIGPLITAINDTDKNVRIKAGRSLEIIIGSNFEAIITAINNNKNFAYRLRLADVLSTIGEPAVDPLIVMLDPNNENDIRRIAAYALGKIGNSLAVNPLVVMLNDGDISIKIAAIAALGEIKNTAAAAPLISIIKNNKEFIHRDITIQRDIKISAIEALGKIGDNISIEFIITLLNKSDRDTLRAAIKTLGNTGDSRAIGLLIPKLEKGEWRIQKESALALDRLGWTPADETEKAFYHVAKWEWDECVNIGKPAIEPLINTFSEGYIYTAHGVNNALRRIGPPAVKPLIKALKHKNWRVRAAVSETLGIMRKKQAVKPLIETLKDESREVRARAAIALDKLKWAPANKTEKTRYYIAKENWNKCIEIGKPAVEPLIASLKFGNNFHVKIKEALIKIGAPAIESLVPMLDDKDRQNRQTASEILSIIVTNRIIIPLSLDLMDADWRVRMNAADILTRLNWTPANDIEKTYYFIAKREWDKCAELGKPAVEPLLELFGTKIKNVSYMDVTKPSPGKTVYSSRSLSYVRKEVSKTLVKIGAPALVEAYVYNQENNRDLNFAFADILAGIGKPAAKILIEKLKDSDSEVRKKCVAALGMYKDTEAVDALISILKDKDIKVRKEAVKALGSFRDRRIIKPLINTLEDKDIEIRNEAIESLGKIGIMGDEEVINTIEKALDIPELKDTAERVLKEIEETRAYYTERRKKVKK